MSAACERITASLPAFVGGDLDAATAEAVRVHLLGCHRCRGEAAGLQRALGGLRRLDRQLPAGVGDDFFASMHDTIVAECAAAEPRPAVAPHWWRWTLAAAAAAALLAIGFWCGHGPGVSVWDRPPLGTSAAFEEPKAVPYSGPRVPLRLLGNDGNHGTDGNDANGNGRDAANGGAVEPGFEPGPRDPGTGLRARDRLRSLVDDGMLLPPRREK